MEKIFENRTTYNPQEYAKFKNFHIQKYSVSYLTKTLIFSLCFILFAVAQFYSHHIGMGIVFILILFIFVAWRLYHPSLFNKKQANRKAIKEHTTYIFTFYPHFFTIKSKKENYRFYYFRLHRIFETDGNFYLYINTNYAFVLSKEGFTFGNPFDFLDFIKKKAPFKYRK